MSDRELLENAAKAAGISSDCFHDRYDHWDKDHAPVLVGRAWNPLSDDGDALRLAVNLRHELGTGIAQCFGIGRFDEYKDDPLAATRRAIVRAAAEIGKAKP